MRRGEKPGAVADAIRGLGDDRRVIGLDARRRHERGFGGDGGRRSSRRRGGTGGRAGRFGLGGGFAGRRCRRNNQKLSIIGNLFRRRDLLRTVHRDHNRSRRRGCGGWIGQDGAGRDRHRRGGACGQQQEQEHQKGSHRSQYSHEVQESNGHSVKGDKHVCQAAEARLERHSQPE